MNEAYKKRDIEVILQRAKHFTEFNMLRQKAKQGKQTTIKDQFVVYPCIDSIESLSDIVNRLSFALPQKDGLNIYVAVSDHLLSKNILELEVPEFQEQYIGRNSNIYFIDKSIAKEYLKTHIILINDMKIINQPEIIEVIDKVQIIDKEYFSDKEAETLRHLFFSTFTLEEEKKFLEISKENFNSMKKKNSGKNKAYCFTTGPSFDNYEEFYFEDSSFKVICNSIAKNEKFLSYIGGADLLVFADPVFHFGPSSYAEQFRQDVIKLVKKYNTYILVPDYNMPLLLAHYPQLHDRLIGMPIKREFNFPSEEKFFIKGSANILTLFMLPLASAISNTIGIVGADGRQENEKYFWKHSTTAQYDDKMESAFQTHPSFFRDRNYQDYYEQHCSFLENLIQYGEKNGKNYYSITSSYIPALKQRYRGGIPSNVALRSANMLKAIINIDKQQVSIKAQPKFLFILTPPYSGSTVLSKILDTSKGTMLLHERGEGQWLIPQMCESDRWDPDKIIDWSFVKSVWFDKYKSELSKNRDIKLIIEKSPPSIVRAEQIYDNFNNALFIAFNRDPYANCSSILHRNYDVKNISTDQRLEIIENLAKLWIFRSKYIRKFIEDHEILYFTYEQFCKSPDKHIKELIKICPELYDVNVDSEVKVKDYASQKIINQNPRQIAWLTNDDKNIISSILSEEIELMNFFGYRIEN